MKPTIDDVIKLAREYIEQRSGRRKIWGTRQVNEICTKSRSPADQYQRDGPAWAYKDGLHIFIHRKKLKSTKSWWAGWQRRQGVNQ